MGPTGKEGTSLAAWIGDASVAVIPSSRACTRCPGLGTINIVILATKVFTIVFGASDIGKQIVEKY
jgi:hypothetical protein